MATLEDVLEESSWARSRTSSTSAPRFVRLTPRRWKIGGGVPMAEVAGRLGLSAGESVGTFAAWVRRHHGRVGPPGWSGQLGELYVIARQVRRGLVYLAIVELAREPGGA